MKLPWWVLFLLCIYFLIKIQFLVESPCSILGTSSPVDRPRMLREFRKISLCTHADKVRHLQLGERRDAEILFQRASVARDGIAEALRGGSKNVNVSCATGLEIELSVIQWLSAGLSSTENWSQNLSGLTNGLQTYLHSIVTFEQGLGTSLGHGILLFAIFGMLRKLLQYFLELGPLGLLKSVIQACVFGIIPTIASFFASPFVRWYIFIADLFETNNSTVVMPVPTDIADVSLTANLAATPTVPVHLRNRTIRKHRFKQDAEQTKQDALFGTGAVTTYEGMPGLFYLF